MAALSFVEKTIVAVSDGSTYINDVFPSPTGKYILRGTILGVPTVAIRNDVTGNYDTTTSWVGSPAIGISSIAWAADESKLYVGATNGAVYIATVDTGTDTFTYVGGFATGSSEVRGISVSPPERQSHRYRRRQRYSCELDRHRRNWRPAVITSNEHNR
jgi:WD40 repeat protein